MKDIFDPRHLDSLENYYLLQMNKMTQCYVCRKAFEGKEELYYDKRGLRHIECEPA